MTPGDLCVVKYPFTATYIDDGITYARKLLEGEIFMLVSTLEIEQLSVIEVEILFENKKMWFNIQPVSCIIENVRRAESYDIPFMTLQEDEPGSNFSSLVKTYSPTPPTAKGYFSHFLSSSARGTVCL